MLGKEWPWPRCRKSLRFLPHPSARRIRGGRLFSRPWMTCELDCCQLQVRPHRRTGDGRWSQVMSCPYYACNGTNLSYLCCCHSGGAWVHVWGIVGCLLVCYRGLKVRYEIFSAGTDASYLRLVSLGSGGCGVWTTVLYLTCMHVQYVVGV